MEPLCQSNENWSRVEQFLGAGCQSYMSKPLNLNISHNSVEKYQFFHMHASNVQLGFQF